MRDASIYISSSLLRRLRAAAQLLELPNAEYVAEIWLTQKLNEFPEVEQLIEEQSKASQKIREAWKAKQLTLFVPELGKTNEQPRP